MLVFWGKTKIYYIYICILVSLAVALAAECGGQQGQPVHVEADLMMRSHDT